MATTLSSLSLFASTVTSTTAQPWLLDAKCLPMPWRRVERPNRLRIGIMWDDGIVRPTPPVRRALRETAEKLRAAGHEVVDWEPVDHDKLTDILVRNPSPSPITSSPSPNSYAQEQY